jgi:hypothetical protein
LAPAAPREDKETDRFRRAFYGAYGRFWIALPVAFLVNGLYTMYSGTYLRPESPGNADLYDQASVLYYINIGTMVVAGGFLAESLYRMFRYIYAAGKNQPKAAR